MEEYVVVTIVVLISMTLIGILTKYNVKYKGKCILHDWEYTFDRGDYWKYNNKSYGRYLKNNERFECKKCYKGKM